MTIDCKIIDLETDRHLIDYKIESNTKRRSQHKNRGGQITSGGAILNIDMTEVGCEGSDRPNLHRLKESLATSQQNKCQIYVATHKLGSCPNHYNTLP